VAPASTVPRPTGHRVIAGTAPHCWLSAAIIAYVQLFKAQTYAETAVSTVATSEDLTGTASGDSAFFCIL
jgi:hypothetical protein